MSPKKKVKQPKQTDRAITIEDLAELLVAMDKKVLALENELIIKALKSRNSDEVCRILLEEF